MKEGDRVKVVHCERSRFMNQDFVKWIDNHSNRTFTIIKVNGDSARLKGVNFTVSKEFLIVL